MRALIYSKDFCPYCDMAKKLLEEKGVQYKEINISKSKEPENILQEIRELTDQRTFPQVVLDGKHIGGYTDLRDYYYENKSS